MVPLGINYDHLGSTSRLSDGVGEHLIMEESFDAAFMIDRESNWWIRRDKLCGAEIPCYCRGLNGTREGMRNAISVVEALEGAVGRG